jgi:hypothetical protein
MEAQAGPKQFHAAACTRFVADFGKMSANRKSSYGGMKSRLKGHSDKRLGKFVIGRLGTRGLWNRRRIPHDILVGHPEEETVLKT